MIVHVVYETEADLRDLETWMFDPWCGLIFVWPHQFVDIFALIHGTEEVLIAQDEFWIISRKVVRGIWPCGA